MPQFKLDVLRTETYTAEIAVEAESLAEAVRKTQARFDAEGWDAVVDDDGEYDTCVSEVVTTAGAGDGSPTFPNTVIGDLKFEDGRDDGCNLLGAVRFFGVSSHVCALRVENFAHDSQRAFNSKDREPYDALCRIYAGPFRTVRIPGFEGDFVVYSHPYEARS